VSKATLHKIHRWISITFALPLLAIVATGLILSFEPMVQLHGVVPKSVDAAKVIGLMRQFDPAAKARGVSIDAAAQRLRLQGNNLPEIDLATGQVAQSSGALAGLFLWARRTHERLIGLSWLVTVSTVAMLTTMLIGIFMGLPRLRNTLSGWHKGAAWFTLPLILLSPITGLLMAFNVTFQSSAAPSAGGRTPAATTSAPAVGARQPLSLIEAVSQVAKSHDLAAVTSIATRGGRMMARIFDDSELRAYSVTGTGVTALPRNWPRLLHEGNWSAMLSGSLNVLVSVVLFGLLTTGLLIWGRRQLRRRQPRPA
jgi:uncharacterized iron-regulated membrane protein